MSRRTQITITDEQHARLSALSEETGLSMSELVRRALDRTYTANRVRALGESFGAWRGRQSSGSQYVE
ncbi:MAG TPA: ribbon-helix-helix domain-containing protein, partial [Actinomycetota bacterium]|nr:ribbon-helix-helix domain-containing protein [Actinomycetota bacterium]